MGNEVTKKQPFMTVLSQLQDKFTTMVVETGAKMEIRYDDYQKLCMMNVLSRMYMLATENGLDVLSMDRSQITDIIQTAAMLNLNISATPRECYIIIRNKKVGNDWKKEFEFNIEGNGNDKLLRKFGVDVEKVYVPWAVRENDSFTYPSFNGLEITPPTWQPKDYTGKVVRIVYPIQKADGTVEYHIAEREGVVHNLQAHISNNLMKNKDVKDAEKERLNQLAASMTLDEILNSPDLLPYVSPAWKSSGGREAMIERKMRNNAIKKYPKEFSNAFAAQLYEKSYEDYEQYENADDPRINKEEALEVEIVDKVASEKIDSPNQSTTNTSESPKTSAAPF